MRFLFVMLSCVWILFGWASFSALRYRPPLPPPWTAIDSLDRIPLPELNHQIQKDLSLLQTNSLPSEEAVEAHLRLSGNYWLKAYHQPTRAKQTLLLNKALQELLIVLKNQPDNFPLYFRAADLYHQLRDYDKAEEYYRKCLRLNPSDEYLNRRYQDLLEERKQTEDS